MNMDEYGIWIYEYGRIINATVRKVVFHFSASEERTEIFLNLQLTCASTTFTSAIYYFFWPCDFS